MKIFRSHIIKLTGAFALLIGIALHFIYPSSDKVRHEAFASWLQSQVKSPDNSTVIDQIHKLASEDGELDEVIRKASELVTSNSDDFELPVKNQDENEDEVFHLLLSEWNNYQTSPGGMGKAVFTEQAKTPSLLPKDLQFFTGKTIPVHSRFVAFASEASPYIGAEYNNYTLSPLSGGISINAP